VRQIVSNAGPLISLEKLKQGYGFIRCLYDNLIVSPAVLEEVAVGQFATPDEYLQHYDVSDLIDARLVSQQRELPKAARLHEGETQAIQLAVELQLPLLIEETVGRRVVQSVGIQISGIAGQVMKAFRQDLIAAIEAHDKLSELLRVIHSASAKRGSRNGGSLPARHSGGSRNPGVGCWIPGRGLRPCPE
jgi:predicted nucleic acid-binding protein